MALVVNFKSLIGQMTIAQKQHDGVTRRFKIDICTCNALAAFISHRTDINGEKWNDLYWFFMDAQHIRNIIRSGKRILPDDVVSIKLNMYYTQAKTLLHYLTKDGYKVTCYYKEPKPSKKNKK